MKHLVSLLILSSLTLGVVLYSRIEPDAVAVKAGPTHAPARALVDVSTTTTTAPPTTTATPKRTRSGAMYPSDELLDRLAYCETGGTMDPATNTGNGFYGAFQFTIGTWWSVGGEGYPSDHPYEVQRDLARTLILQAGWSQFPTCSIRIGVR